ncbi:phosphoribosylglycinamide formyltransferase-1 [Bacillus ectoiniformans]|uniref:phosphoribosylglycinamide formyltransferase n=1 Tax=Bacillus ectoiniformans TaxID=1494429 RepID=UPI00195BE22C|nr:phosphoribosylglycinamide formyltransferase [Bacillus ectoiniformans]MBM7650176.1 phosphoribosylglycinamide formyltransferase-1 [Bacillus ectoiniformans]
MRKGQLTKIAVFASGSGSNFEAIAEQITQGKIDAEIALLVCDKPDAYAVKRAEKHHIPVFAFRSKEYSSKQEFEQVIVKKLKDAEVEFIFLAGYMRLIGETLLEAYPEKIVNIHPSLLPAFPGKDAIGQAINYKVKITGVTVHYVDAGMDTGPIIEQESVRVSNDESRETLQAKIQRVEHELYPKVVKQLVAKTVKEEEIDEKARVN